MTSLTLRYVAQTDVGLRRTNNQDSGYASSRLLVIADGMGGAAAGDLASSEALNVVRRLDTELEQDALTALELAVDRANTRLGELISDDPAVEGMGTTLEAMLFDGEKFAVAHLGDSRTYRLRDGVLTQLNPDHTFVQSLVEEGRITADEARQHPHRSLLLRAMLGRDDNAADYSWLQPQPGDRYLLCSDGLSDMVPDERIAEALGAVSIDVAATALITLALEGGGHDNVTVVIGEMVPADADHPDDAALSCADGAPQLVGAAANSPQPRTGRGGHGHRKVSTSEEDLDPELARYAPREPSRWLRMRSLLAIALALILVVGGGIAGYQWSQTQYFVSDSDGRVAIYKGVPYDIPLIELNHVDEVTDVKLSELTKFQQNQVREGIEANSRADAEEIIAELRPELLPVEPTPTPTPEPVVPEPDPNAPVADPAAPVEMPS